MAMIGQSSSPRCESSASFIQYKLIMKCCINRAWQFLWSFRITCLMSTLIITRSAICGGFCIIPLNNEVQLDDEFSGWNSLYRFSMTIYGHLLGIEFQTIMSDDMFETQD